MPPLLLELWREEHPEGHEQVQLDFTSDPNATIEAAIKHLRDGKLTEPNDNLVILSDVSAGHALVDCVQLRQVKDFA